MIVEVQGPDFRKIMSTVQVDIAAAATDAMRETTFKALRELRAQVTGAGLGNRLANTWRDRVYPESRKSINPSGYIWSNAPDIITSFVKGGTIRPAPGGKYLWIPTDNVPNARGRRGATRKMTPEQVENLFNTDFTFRKGKSGSLLAFIDVFRAKNGRGSRPATKGRVRQGRKTELELMFVLRRTVTMPRLLDLDGPAERWAANFNARFTARLEAL